MENYTHTEKLLPDDLRDIGEFQAICDALNAEIDTLLTYIWQVRRAPYVLDADEYGISRHEKALGIIPADGDTLEDRRFRVLSTYAGDRPYTERTLYNMLTELCGADAVYLKIDVQNFKITVRIGLQSKSMYDSAVKLINRVKPCNMLLDHKLQYRTWREVKDGTNSWADLTPYTWQDIYEKEGIING